MSTMEYIEYLLKNYFAIKDEIEELKIMLECPVLESEDDTIQSMTFATPVSERVDSSKISDKTGRTAIVYKEVNRRINKLARKDIEQTIAVNKFELYRIDHAIKRLDEKLKNIVYDLYFNGCSWGDITAKYHISNNTLSRYRRKAIRRISEAYDLIRLTN